MKGDFSFLQIHSQFHRVRGATMSTKAKGDLPEDIIFDILSRLPVKSLLRFKAVCNPWYSLIENPVFISEHCLKQAEDSHLVILVKHSFGEDHYFSALSTSQKDHHEWPMVTETIYVPFTTEFFARPAVLGPCNGLLCLYDPWGKIAIWNPATREVKPLPPSPIHRPSIAMATRFGNIGFGVDPKTNDYKVIRFVHHNYYNGGMNSVNQVELYSLRSDSWREIPDFGALACSVRQFNTYLNGVYHWWAYADGESIILSFEMTTEVFSTTPLPDFGERSDDRLFDLTSFNDSLAIISCTKEVLEKVFHIWVMDKYGVKESWTKQLTIGPLLRRDRILGFWENRGLFLESCHGQLVFYDSSSKEIKDLQIQGGGQDTLQVLSYCESLVPINGRREDEDQTFIRHRIQQGNSA